jgi:hypothetical protein
VESRNGDCECVEDTTSDYYYHNKVGATDECFHCKDKKKCGKVKGSTHIPHGKNSDKPAWVNWLRKEGHYAL